MIFPVTGFSYKNPMTNSEKQLSEQSEILYSTFYIRTPAYKIQVRGRVQNSRFFTAVPIDRFIFCKAIEV